MKKFLFLILICLLMYVYFNNSVNFSSITKYDMNLIENTDIVLKIKYLIDLLKIKR